MCLKITLEYMSNTSVFHEMCVRRLRLKQESDFVFENRIFGLQFHFFCREFADSIALGKHFALLNIR